MYCMKFPLYFCHKIIIKKTPLTALTKQNLLCVLSKWTPAIMDQYTQLSGNSEIIVVLKDGVGGEVDLTAIEELQVRRKLIQGNPAVNVIVVNVRMYIIQQV
uniref:Uncharacterized protein n=1 Tax=Cacopsylla melanoneura TaxID=428564 RepID=A0A8D9ABU2_9HEMI